MNFPMVFEITPAGLQQLLDALYAGCPAPVKKSSPKAACPDLKDKFYPIPKEPNGWFCPSISRVIFNEDATIVLFDDGTKSTVLREGDDSYDRTTAVTYAIVKRLLATAYNAKTNAVNAAYINTIHGLVAAGYDQQAEEKAKAEKEATAQAEHEARQKALQDKAFKRRVKARLRELRVEQAAKDALAGKKPLNESAMPSSKEFFSNKPTATCQDYRRPNKPFSKFTDKEKREYWRYHNAKRRAAGN